ncbi:MAG: HAMP domain-containing protein [Lachnospiraceae bacterium]
MQIIKRNKLYIIASVIIIILVLSRSYATNRTYHVTYMVDSCTDEKNIYFIDRNEEQTKIIKTNRQKKFLREISLKNSDDSNIYRIKSISDWKGNAYVHVNASDADSSETKTDIIYKCDFKKGELIPWVHLKAPTDSICNFQLIRVEDNRAIVSASHDNQMWIYGVKKDGVLEQLDNTELDYDYGYERCFYSEMGESVYINMLGDLTLHKNGQPTELPESLRQKQFLQVGDNGKDSLFFMNLQDQTFCNYNVTLGTVTPINKEKDIESKVLNEDSEIMVLNTLTCSTMEMIRCCAKDLMKCLIPLILLFLIINAVKYISNGIHPIAFKIMGVVICALVISILILDLIVTAIMRENLKTSKYRQLYTISREITDKVSFDYIKDINLQDIESRNLYSWQGDELYNNMVKGMMYNYEAGSVQQEYSNGKKPIPVSDATYRSLYIVDNQQDLKVLYSAEGVMGTPISYLFDKKTESIMNKSVKNKQIVIRPYQNHKDRRLSLFVPITIDNQTVGLLEIGMPESIVQQEAKTFINEVYLCIIAIFILLGLIIFILITHSLAPLKKLKQSAIAISNGKLGVTLNVRGNDEISEITQVFNRMSGSIGTSLEDMRKVTEGYYKFVPFRMFQLLQRESITEVNIGDLTSTDLTILNIKFSDFDEDVRKMSADEIFKMVNDVLDDLIPIVQKYDGVVERFEKGGLIAIFENNHKDVMNCAVNMKKELNKFPGRFAISITRGMVKLGIIGDKNRQFLEMMSEHIYFNYYMQDKGLKYYANILVSYSLLKEISGFEHQYKIRLLGYFYRTSTDTVEKIYDLYEADSEETIFLKDVTKEDFEMGIHLFMSKHFYDARLKFIDVLKENRKDSAAKEYLYLCDLYYKVEDTSDIETMLETF